MFLLGDEAREHAKRSIKALKALALRQDEGNKDHANGSAPGPRSAVFLVLNTSRELIHVNDYTPRIIPVTHKLHSIDEKSIALIARDSSYKKHLTGAKSATEDLFNDIVPFSKIKSIAHNKQAAVRLIKENEILIADARIHKRLPELLGARFYGKNKRVPYKILMSEPEPGKKTHGRTDQLCNPKFVRAQVKSILGNTSFIAPAGGTCIHIMVGYTNWKVSEILTNINDVVEYLTNEKHLPNGGLLGSVGNLHSVLVKTSSSVAMPVMPKREADESDSQSDD